MDIGKYISLLRGMVRIPSHSFEEGRVADLLCSFLEKEGVSYCRERGNILALNRFFDASKPTLALDAHIDTVPPAESYSRDPYDPGDDPEAVLGLGSNDDGGSVVAMTAAFSHFYEAALPFNLMLVLTCEEERSGADGAKHLYASDGFLRSGAGFPAPDWAVVGEPTGMKAATSERGLLVLDGEAHGISGHAARGEGVNAIYIAMDDISLLRGHKFGRHSELMGDVRLNVTQIEAGSVHNIIPDVCRFTVDIRPTEQYTNEEIWKELQGLCRSRLTPRRLTNRSSATRPGSPLLKAAEAVGLETFSSPTTSDWMLTGCDSIKIGPGDSSRSHHADEFIYVGEVADAVEKYCAFISAFRASF